MKFKIGDYGIWKGHGRIIIFRVYRYERISNISENFDWYICKALYDNRAHYPRDRVHLPTDDEDMHKINIRGNRLTQKQMKPLTILK